MRKTILLLLTFIFISGCGNLQYIYIPKEPSVGYLAEDTIPLYKFEKNRSIKFQNKFLYAKMSQGIQVLAIVSDGINTKREILYNGQKYIIDRKSYYNQCQFDALASDFSFNISKEKEDVCWSRAAHFISKYSDYKIDVMNNFIIYTFPYYNTVEDKKDFESIKTSKLTIEKVGYYATKEYSEDGKTITFTAFSKSNFPFPTKYSYNTAKYLIHYMKTGIDCFETD